MQGVLVSRSCLLLVAELAALWHRLPDAVRVGIAPMVLASGLGANG